VSAKSDFQPNYVLKPITYDGLRPVVCRARVTYFSRFFMLSLLFGRSSWISFMYVVDSSEVA